MTRTRNAANAPPRTSGVRQHPVGTNHFQFRLHQPAGWAGGCGGGTGVNGGGGGGGAGSMAFFHLPAEPSRALFRSRGGFGLCSENPAATVAPYDFKTASRRSVHHPSRGRADP